MYQGSFTPDAVGTWKVLWTCTSPLARMLKTYFVVTDQLTDILADTNETQGKLPTNNIMGSSDKADHDDEINDILTDTNEIQTKLPDNFIMGSSVSTDKDDEIDDILVDTNEIQGKLPNNNIMGSSDKDDHDIDIDNILLIVTDIDTDLGEPTDAVGTGTVHGKLGSVAEFVGHDSIKVELIDIAAALGGSCDMTGA